MTRFLILLSFMLSLSAVAQDTLRPLPGHADDWRRYGDKVWQLEAVGIKKLAQFTANERSAILFTVAGDFVGYANSGAVKRLNLLAPDTYFCQNPHPSLSHGGRMLAYVTDGESKGYCRIVLYDVVTGEQRTLAEMETGSEELSWSWDDSEIAFNAGGPSGPSIGVVTVSSGVRRLVHSFKEEFEESIKANSMAMLSRDAPLQWTHVGRGFLLQWDVDMPTKQPGAYQPTYRIDRFSDGNLSVFADGYSPAISPASDRVAYCADGAIVTSDLDGSKKRTVANSPEGLWGPITWSPDEKRLFFHLWVSENGNDKVYLLDTESGHYKQFLAHTSIWIRDWR